MTKKLYVWTDVLTDWTSGIVVVLADSEEQARETIAAEDDFAARDIERVRPKVYDCDRETPVVFVVHGGS